MTSFFMHKNMFAYVLVGLTWYQLFLVWNWQHLGKWVKLMLSASLPLSLLCLALSDSRGAQMGFGISFVVAMGVAVYRSNSIVVRWRLSVILAVGGMLSVFFVLIPDAQLSRVVSVYVSSSPEPGFRSWAWEAGWEAFQQKPVFGHGAGSYLYVAPEFEDPREFSVANPFMISRHAHNHYLQVLVEKGMVGFLLETVLQLGALLFLVLAARSRSKPALFAFLCLLSFSIHNFVAEASEYPVPALMYWGLIGYGWSYAPFKTLQAPMKPWMGHALLAVVFMVWALASVRLSRYLVSDWHFRQHLSMEGEQPEQALASLIRSLKTDARHTDANYAMATQLIEKGKYRPALMQLDWMESHAPNIKPTSILRAEAFYGMGMLDSAKWWAQKTLAKYPYELRSMEILVRSAQWEKDCGVFDSLQKELKTTFAVRYGNRVNPTVYTKAKLLKDFREHPKNTPVRDFLSGARDFRVFSETVRDGVIHNLMNHERLQRMNQLRCEEPFSLNRN